MDRNQYIENIKKVISTSGYYLTSVIPCPQPGFVYTIGLINSLKFELVFCGTANYDLPELQEIVDKVQEMLSQGLTIDQNFNIENFGNFTLRQTDASWNEKILLGVFDIFDLTEITAYQIVPEEKNKLLDIPDMTQMGS
ncbi:DUF4262 domain-containing protein [Chryseobacterium arachidis]|uniref:DUF4262 domain-containing protein n=1 Tax=Chryseobacterium arachidis TaxID=1416778 RepID=UPI00360F0A85